MVGPKLYGALEMGDRLGESLEPQQRDSQRVVGVGAAGSQGLGFAGERVTDPQFIAAQGDQGALGQFDRKLGASRPVLREFVSTARRRLLACSSPEMGTFGEVVPDTSSAARVFDFALR